MIVRTVLGDIQPSTLGITLGHEHVFARPPADVTDPDLILDDEDKSIAELASFRGAGGGSVVEMTTRDYGNDAKALVRISRAAGVHIVAATGFNKGRFSDRLSTAMSTEAIRDWIISEVCVGIDRSTARAGLIKAASGLDGPGPDERRVFEAAAEAHLVTGAPISTHTEKGTWGDGQIALLSGLGVPFDRILVGHLDLKPDLAYLREIASTGVFLGFDQFSKHKYLPDFRRIELISELAADGHGHQIIISGDLARRSYLEAWGGRPGYRYFVSGLPKKFADAGLGRELYSRLQRDNPRRFLGFTPRMDEAAGGTGD